MAKQALTHLHSYAGFSGHRWDINLGHNQLFSPAANDVTIVGSTISLTAGTFPTWLAPDKKFIYNSPANPLLSLTVLTYSANSITVAETPVAEAGVTATFNGSEDVGIQSKLLKNLALPTDEAVLTEDTPHLIVSSGALGASRILDISALEVESAARGGKELKGRPHHLSIQNTDINNSGTGYSITVHGSGLINGAANFVITTPNDYWLTHDENGNWIVLILPAPGDKIGVIKRVPFAATKWGAHPTNKNTIVCIQTGAPVQNQVGPHELANYDSYLVQVWNSDYATFTELTDCEIKVDKSTGDITLQKAQGAQSFNGEVIIGGTLD